jgi:glycosyltransferase involved in cell wall biosynthesis
VNDLAVSATICLVSPGHVASNPRLVKEAAALCDAGFQVRVVAADYVAAVRPLDAAVLRGAAWKVRKVGLGNRWGRRFRALRRRACAWLVQRNFVPHVKAALWAENDLVGQLARAAVETPADLYVGHYLPGLAAAAHAAQVHRACLGFDAEDSHVDELPDAPPCAGRRAARASIERMHLSHCRHLTAASPGIADALRGRYGVQPRVVLNVFPLEEAPTQPTETNFLRGEGQPQLYWFSQTVGPGRGLESVLEAMGRLRTPAQLHLRGICSSRYRGELEELASRMGMFKRLHWHEPAAPDQMVHLCAEQDLGLALELNEPRNRAICLTNKIFTYLLAGVPMLLSRTPAQEHLAAELGPAALLMDLADPEGLAAKLDAFFADSGRQREARTIAWKLGRERFNWNREQHEFLRSVRCALGMNPA